MKRSRLTIDPLEIARIHIRVSIGVQSPEKLRAVSVYEFRMKYWFQLENIVKHQLRNFRKIDYEESENEWLE